MRGEKARRQSSTQLPHHRLEDTEYAASALQKIVRDEKTRRQISTQLQEFDDTEPALSEVYDYLPLLSCHIIYSP